MLKGQADRWFRTGVFAAVVSLASGAGRLAGQVSSCLTAEPDASNYISVLLGSYTAFGADSTLWLAGGSPFSTDSAAITLVTDSSTCALAVAAYNVHYNLAGGTAVPALFVVRVGTTGYVTIDPNDRAGEWIQATYWDSNWAFKTRGPL